MLRPLLYLVAVILFAVALFAGGITTGWQDLIALGLVFVAAAGLLDSLNWRPVPR